MNESPFLYTFDAPPARIDISNLSHGAIIVLDALIRAVESATGGEHGFMDEAFSLIHPGDGINKPAFAAYVNAVWDFIEWSEDLSKDPGVACNAVQFAVTKEAYAARGYIRRVCKRSQWQRKIS